MRLKKPLKTVNILCITNVCRRSVHQTKRPDSFTDAAGVISQSRRSEPNANELEQRIFLICIRFGA